jgi:hypothetical protein
MQPSAVPANGRCKPFGLRDGDSTSERSQNAAKEGR